ncbi:transposase [Burkholderia pseudomallei]|uniref:transposase n=1 Tax=Burkholderia pseudomallei TaxID=28450 RepID=UPI00406C7814
MTAPTWVDLRWRGRTTAATAADLRTSAAPLLRRQATGMKAGAAAVCEAITSRWSNGVVEGHVNRLKMLKRQMYGRAGYELLRRRVISPLA